MAQLFISYARVDGRELATRLEEDLRAAGHEPWRDKREIIAGETWAQEIEDGINRCEALIAVLTKGAYDSKICRGEQMRALRLGRRIVPLLAEGDADRPIYLEGAHYLDFTVAADYAQRFAELIDHLAQGGGTDRGMLTRRVHALMEADGAIGAGLHRPGAPADIATLRERAAAQCRRWRDTLAGRGRSAGVFERELYVERGTAQAELQRFEAGDRVALLLAGEPGIGKTNLIAHWAEGRVERGDAVVVYAGDAIDAARLESTIARDLGLDDAAALEAAWPALQAMLEAAGQRLWIVVDGLNDVRDGSPGARALLLALDACVARREGQAVRVLVSCTLGSWQRIERRERLALAWGRYHQAGGTDMLVLEGFTPEEAAQAFARHAQRTPLPIKWDDLPPAFRRRLAEPVLLRLLAESLQGQPAPDPGVDFDALVFKRYWEERLRSREQQLLADALAAEMIAQRSAALPLTPLLSHPRLGAALADESPDGAYYQLLDAGVLVEVGGRDLFDDARLRFTHPHIGAYAIVRNLLPKLQDLAATLRELVAIADELPLAWEAAITLAALRADAAAYRALAGDADAELRELALEALVRHHGSAPAKARALLVTLLDDGNAEQQRTALRAAFRIGPAARDLIVRAALSAHAGLRQAVRDTLYFLWAGAPRPGGPPQSTSMYFVWRHAPDFTRALMQDMAGRLSWMRPWEARRILGFLLDLSITIYVNHCERRDVVEHTAALFHQLCVDQLHLDRLHLPRAAERVVLRVVASVVGDRVLQWMLFADDPRPADFFARPPAERAAIGRAAAWLDPAMPLASLHAELLPMLRSTEPVMGGTAALVVALHALADAPAAEPAVRALFDALDTRGRSWLLAAFTVLVPNTPPEWIPLLESLTERLDAEAGVPLLRSFDALYVPLGLAYAKRGAAMPLFAKLIDRDPARRERLVAALGVVGFYHPRAVLEWLRPMLPALLQDPVAGRATLGALATMRALHFEAVDHALVQAGASEAQRRDVAVLADPERVQRFMRLLGYYNNAVYQCVHYPRMRRGLSAHALSLLASVRSPAEFVAGYATQAHAMAREARFDLTRWTLPDEG